MKSPYTFKHIPPTENLNEKKPAIFLLHGLGSNEDDLLQLVGEFKGQCHIFSLRGPITHKPGFAFYTFEEEGKPTREVFDKVINFTNAFILEAIEEFELDINQIYVIGFNQGAVVAQTLLITLGRVIKGVAALSGFLPAFVKEEYNTSSLNQSNIFISHGEYDYDYPLQWSEISKQYFIDLGASVTYKVYPDGHGVSPDNLRDLVAFIAENLAETKH
ncbi:alpha/beta hydrolase [Ureibacillus sp. NPDC094379]